MFVMLFYTLIIGLPVVSSVSDYVVFYEDASNCAVINVIMYKTVCQSLQGSNFNKIDSRQMDKIAVLQDFVFNQYALFHSSVLTFMEYLLLFLSSE